MKSLSPRSIRAWSFVLLIVWSSTAKADTTSVLFIGNSYTYTNDLPGMFRLLALSMGDTVETEMIAPGGYTFQQHSTDAATQAAIAQGDWDFVVLQEQSQLPAFDPAQVATQVYPFATALVDQIHTANACTEVVFFMTWGRENGDADNCASYPPICTYYGMQQRLHESYVTMAQDNYAWCAPVGEVWSHQFTISPGMPLYAADGSHPSVLGSYVAAATLYTTMFRRSCLNATYVPAGLFSNQSYVVRLYAEQIVLEDIELWNVGVNDPEAQFTYTDLGDGSFQFTDQTIGSVANDWSFGDGGMSTATNPQHIYGADGTFSVEMIAYDGCGRSDTSSLELAVISIGVPEAQQGSSAYLWMDARNERIIVQNNDRQGWIELIDPVGRSLYEGRLSKGTTSVPIDNSWHGTVLWRMNSGEGPAQSGMLYVP